MINSIQSFPHWPILAKRKAGNSLKVFFSHWLVFLVLFFLSVAARSQQADSVSQQETTQTDLISRVQRIGKEGAEKSILEFKKEKESVRQEKLIAEMQKVLLKARAYLKRGIDTLRINRELEDIKKWMQVAGDGVFTSKGTIQTHRNLETTSKILLELVNRIKDRKKQLDDYENALFNFRLVVDSLNSDTLLHQFPDDSAAVVQYAKKYMYVSMQLAPVDSALKHAISQVRELQAKVNFEAYTLDAYTEELELYQKELSHGYFDRHLPGLGEPPNYQRPLNEVLAFSNSKGKLVFSFYTQHHWGKILLLFLLVAGSAFFLRSLREIVKKQNLLRSDFAGQLVLRYPLLSAIVIVFNLFQFIFPDPPFIYNILIWATAAISLNIIFRGYITKFWISFWLTMLFFFIAACYDNLILQASRTERWLMLLLSVAGIAAAVFFLVSRRKSELREKLILFFIALAVLFEFASAFTNIYGRYNLSKALFISGFLNVIIGILFLWAVRLINEGLTLASAVYTKQERKLFYVNFERVGEKAPPLLYVLLVIGWFILLGRNFYEFRFISQPLKNFVFDTRTIGSYSFTIHNVFLFFVIMLLAVAVSRIISFFASDKQHPLHNTDSKQRKAGLGSWLLLVRVAVISAGLFLALAASGFPLDRITIALGALGVGVGLGLQGLVSNLVSGLILAFEKPVNVGDIVEISGQVGTMKSIGFRSSVFSTSNGADVIIPNSDLLNAHLVNWTLGGNKRQLDLLIAVGHGTDLENLKQILLDLLAKDELVLKYPGPGVWFEKFENSVINVRIYFWVNDYRLGAFVKSAVITTIDKTLSDQNISIAIPRQEVIVHTENGSPGNQPVEKQKPGV